MKGYIPRTIKVLTPKYTIMFLTGCDMEFIFNEIQITDEYSGSKYQTVTDDMYKSSISGYIEK